MYKFLTLLCLALVVKSVFTAVARQPPAEIPEEFEDEEGCYSTELNMVIPFSTSYSPPGCEVGCKQYNCQDDGWITIFTCGAVAAGPGCKKVKGDLSLSYPDCCDTVKCKKNSGPVSAVG